MARTQSAESHSGLLQERHSGRATGRQGEKAGRPAERSEERRDDPGQKARGGSAGQERVAESPAAFMMDMFSPETKCHTVCFSPLSLFFFFRAVFLKLSFTGACANLIIKTHYEDAFNIAIIEYFSTVTLLCIHTTALYPGCTLSLIPNL